MLRVQTEAPQLSYLTETSTTYIELNNNSYIYCTFVDDKYNPTPRGINTTPTENKVNIAHFGVKIGCHEGKRCCRKGVSVELICVDHRTCTFWCIRL